MSKREKEHLVRVCVLGSTFTGKSCLCNRFVCNNFEWVYEPTTEVRPYRKLVNITEDEENKQYCMMLIEDLFPINHPYLQNPEQSEEAKNMSNQYDLILENRRESKKKSSEKALYKEHPIHAYVYVFDLTEKTSFDEVERVIEYIHTREEKEAGKKKSGIAVKILVGTKKDLQRNAVPSQKIEQVKKKYNLMYRKVSALENSDVKDVFLDVARIVMDSMSSGMNEDEDEDMFFGTGFWNWLGCGGRDEKNKDEDEDEEETKKCRIF
ncbi:unnamed protein product [Blepharisma stoltei]|uniref:Uncharacterized protein n=1 Tax=Blepharisma stoltei TaxID=1481888 RepID=A0AAU9J2A1_9CILI|nr:unnamed protein product [Blepharisma stoltei]